MCFEKKSMSLLKLYILRNRLIKSRCHRYWMCLLKKPKEHSPQMSHFCTPIFRSILWSILLPFALMLALEIHSGGRTNSSTLSSTCWRLGQLCAMFGIFPQWRRSQASVLVLLQTGKPHGFKRKMSSLENRDFAFFIVKIYNILPLQ